MTDLKIGRNQKCPCGSGKKFKNCHGLVNCKNEILNEDDELTFRVVSNDTKSSYEFGTVVDFIEPPYMAFGNIKDIFANRNTYFIIVNVDIPWLLPFDEQAVFDLQFENSLFKLCHTIKQRGQESFSTIDTNRIPRFSALQFQCEMFDIDVNTEINIIPPPEENSIKFLSIIHESAFIRAIVGKSKELISYTLEILNESLKESNESFINHIEKEYSITIDLIPKFETPRKDLIGRIEVPYTGNVNIRIPNKISSEASKRIQDILSQKIKIEKFSRDAIQPQVKNQSFIDGVFSIIHNFAFYCSQHPEALGKLSEEEIRDLLLVSTKVAFTQAEGEPFHFDGKLDFKITNTNNRYEFLTGELKWWTQDRSYSDAFHQAIRKHATGHEKQIFIIMLNRNENVSAVFEKMILITTQQEEFCEFIDVELVPFGSKQKFKKCNVVIRDNKVELIIGIFDFYHQKL